jgi:hypothetical protein
VLDLFLFDSSSCLDYYFSPLRYTQARQRDRIGKPGVIFADMDKHSRLAYREKPASVLIESSFGHAHGYWFLESPVSLEDWEPRAKGWTQHLEADPGGWDATQVLRVPNTRNNKPNKGNKVKVLEYNPWNVYNLQDFPKATVIAQLVDSGPPTVDKRAYALLMEALPMSTNYLLTMNGEGMAASGMLDRSRFAWGMYHELFDLGRTADEVFQLVYPAVWNKHYHTQLWKEIKKAEATR